MNLKDIRNGNQLHSGTWGIRTTPVGPEGCTRLFVSDRGIYAVRAEEEDMTAPFAGVGNEVGAVEDRELGSRIKNGTPTNRTEDRL